jgi:hypothetical protein
VSPLTRAGIPALPLQGATLALAAHGVFGSVPAFARRELVDKADTRRGILVHSLKMAGRYALALRSTRHGRRAGVGARLSPG